ncbi:hypothetical protein NB311A_17329 [Nitrobacter sp. Nb-311A]|nr:hypothetical protein NB311A_17329 [Nitrobacter sp. Nb-311A]
MGLPLMSLLGLCDSLIGDAALVGAIIAHHAA